MAMLSVTPPIINERLSVQPWLDPQLSRLPGVRPLDPCEWIIHDEVFAAQMAYRDDLLATKRDAVFTCLPEADAAAAELLPLIIDTASLTENGGQIARADGLVIDPRGDHLLLIAGRLVQMDICILQETNGRYALTGAVLCFPSSWMLSQKIGRSVGSIHAPVTEYDDKISLSVDRMLGAIRTGRPLWRANNLIYTDPELHQPRAEGIEKPIHTTAPRYVRVERQSFVRLPQTGAVIFGIHTSVVPAASLSKAAHDALATIKPDLCPADHPLT